MSDYDLTGWPLFRSIIDQQQTATSDDAKEKRCFVMCPESTPDTERHVHIQAVVNYIIRPALLDTDFRMIVGQADVDFKKTFKQSLNAIMDHDLVISVLSHADEGLDIQLNAAQAMKRPRIALTPRGQVVEPYNIEDERIIDYDLSVDEILSARSILRLRAAVHDVENQAKSEHPVASIDAATVAAPMGAVGAATVAEVKDVSLHERAHDLTDEKRLEFLQNAEGRVDVLGIAGMSFANIEGAADLFRGRAQSPVSVRLIQVSPRNASLPGLLGGKQNEAIIRVRKEIDMATRAWMVLENESQGGLKLEIRRLIESAPTCSAVVTDKLAMWTPYLSSRETGESPTIESLAGTQHYDVVSQEFDYLWERAKPLKKFTPSGQAQTQSNVNILRSRGPAGSSTPQAAE